MKQNLTEMIFILDRSGSMEFLTDETIGGFNSLIERQREEEGEAEVTTVLFDDAYEILYEHKPIDQVKRLTRKEYYARGCTALLDAVGRTIAQVGKRLEETREEERPEKVIVVITTDGYENASREYSKSKVKEMIELQSNTYKWQFMFLGANMDAVAEADTLGIRPCMAATYTASGTGVRSTFRAMDKVLDFVRSCPNDYDDEEMELCCAEIMEEVE